MTTDCRQSAYQCKTRRQAANYDEEDDKVGKLPNHADRTPLSDTSSGYTPTNKLMTDPFIGTVAGRLAQEIHDEFLVCKICFESYVDPKCLSCLHTFCAKCIERHISAEVTYNKYTDYRDFTCPLCRKRTQLPLGGVKRLPDNFLISGLTELVMRQRASSHSSSSITLTSGQNGRGTGDGLETQPNWINGEESYDRVNALPRLSRSGITYGECEICAQVGWLDRGHSTEPVSKPAGNSDSGRASSATLSQTPVASSKCLDCNKLLCVQCVQRHRNTRVTKDHATYDLHAGKDIECKEHPGESVRFYCEACSTCICVLCTFNEHREHEVTSFGEAVAFVRAELESHLDRAFRRISKAKASLGALTEVSDLVHSLERQIHETSEQFIEVIQRQEQELLHDLHEFVGPKGMELIDQQIAHEQNLEVAQTICKETEAYMDGQEIDMLLAKPELYKKLHQLNDINLSCNDFEPATFEMFFRPGTVQLGYLTNDLSGPPTEQYDYLHLPLSSSQSSIELANRPCINTTSTQTDYSLLEKLLQKEKSSEEKQYRTKGCNTDCLSVSDQETNTRPRGIHTSISFSEIVSNSNSEECLNQLDASKLDFQSMDNLTRARMRRKLREHCNTFDESPGYNHGIKLNGERSKPRRGQNEYAFCRYSFIDKYHH